MERLKAALPFNRIVVLVTFIGGIGTAIVGLAGTFPGAAGQKIAAVGGFLVAAAASVTHLIGNMKWDQSPAGQQAAIAAHMEIISPPGQHPFESPQKVDGDMGAEDFPDDDIEADYADAGPNPEPKDSP